MRWSMIPLSNRSLVASNIVAFLKHTYRRGPLLPNSMTSARAGGPTDAVRSQAPSSVASLRRQRVRARRLGASRLASNGVAEPPDILRPAHQRREDTAKENRSLYDIDQIGLFEVGRTALRELRRAKGSASACWRRYRSCSAWRGATNCGT